MFNLIRVSDNKTLFRKVSEVAASKIIDTKKYKGQEYKLVSLESDLVLYFV